MKRYADHRWVIMKKKKIMDMSGKRDSGAHLV
jgi:hypothetical protein